MAPASQEPEPASATTTRPDSDSSVDNIAQNFCLELSTGVRPVLLGPRSSWFVSLTFALILGSQARSSSASQFRAYATLRSSPRRSCTIETHSPGEQAASALEANLTNLENRLDALLAAFEASEGGAEAPKDTNDTHNGNTPSGQKHNEGSGPDASGAAKKP
ncbi:hypothetical protein GQ607_000442 [Colletotrichum asianum]|uniref:Uncharacterized protein n=1 Tax=Colletotrichum asianum TaxID=702518 RepID=A0A8H3ZXX2_9PEZI|nr:hypothetical protein GQ607_000442 [Colletotrichum asianum]